MSNPLVAINRYVQAGIEPKSPQIIHISLSLSHVFFHRNDLPKARSGFHWCKDEAQKILDTDNSKNAKSLYGLALDALGRFYYQTGHQHEALGLIRESINLAKEIEPSNKERIGVLTINMSSILVDVGEISEALSLLETLIPKTVEEMDSTAVQALVNMSIIHEGDKEKKLVKECLSRARSGALNLDSAELLYLVKRHAAKFNVTLA